MAPKISVVLPTYNVADYIAEAMDSLLEQPVLLHEIIIVDDGCTDGTLAVLQERYSDRPEIRIISQKNQGVGAARHNGLAVASGDFIFFCDPDDVVSPDLFSTFIAQYRANADIELFYFSKRSFIDDAGTRRLQRRNTAASREGWFKNGSALFENLMLIDKYHAATWQYIFRRQVCERFTVELEGRVHEDHLFSINVYLNSQLTYASFSDLYFYRERTGSLTQSHKDAAYVTDSYEAYRKTLAVLKRHLKSFEDPRAVALKFMERNVNALLTKCVKYRVQPPSVLTRLTWQDARDCDVPLYSRWTILCPQGAYQMRRVRYKLRKRVKQTRRS